MLFRTVFRTVFRTKVSVPNVRTAYPYQLATKVVDLETLSSELGEIQE